MLLRHAIPLCRVQIVYRFTTPLPVRFEAQPGRWASFAVSINLYCHERAELLYREDGDTWGTIANSWADREEAEFYCRYGVTLDYHSCWPALFRPAVRARVAEVFIGPHTKIPYASALVEERCWWPVPKAPQRHFLYPEGRAKLREEEAADSAPSSRGMCR